jgi:uncharacterized protein YndB with AHSA1/START domain
MPEGFRIASMVPGLPERVYSAWLDSGAHSAFTGKTAKIDPTIGGKFTTLDGYAHGRTVDLLPGRRIVQTWRTKEFPTAARDSRLEIQFESADGATRLTILHSLLPEGQGGRCQKTWQDRYFAPMRGYFGGLSFAGPPRTPATAAAKVAGPAARPGAARRPPPAKKPPPPARKPAPKKKKPALKRPPARKAPKKAAARRPAKRKTARRR